MVMAVMVFLDLLRTLMMQQRRGEERRKEGTSAQILPSQDLESVLIYPT